MFVEIFREHMTKSCAQIYEIKWNHLPTDLKHWIISHPYQTAFHIANGMVFFAPAASSGPILWGLGFTAQGPRVSMFQRSFVLPALLTLN